MLDPLPISFFPDAHRYRWDPTGEILAHSVTQVKSIVHPMTDRQRKAIDDTKHIWEPRGTHVHACLESFLLGEALLDPGDYDEWVGPLLDHSFWRRVEPVAVEHRLCDLKHSIGGSCDALVRDKANGNLLLLDLKTQSSERAATYSTDIQLGAYLSFLIDHYRVEVAECLTVWARPGKTVVTRAKPDDCLGAWVDTLDAFRLAQDFI
jgi:hypothetical protein